MRESNTHPNPVTAVKAAAPELALQHFRALLEFETDCWDTHAAMQLAAPGFVLLDVRSAAMFTGGHVPGAMSLPHAKIIASRMREFSADTLFVCYCAGPHCNGALRAAIKLAELGFAVKIMVGGITGWLDEGFALQTAATPSG